MTTRHDQCAMAMADGAHALQPTWPRARACICASGNSTHDVNSYVRLRIVHLAHDHVLTLVGMKMTQRHHQRVASATNDAYVCGSRSAQSTLPMDVVKIIVEFAISMDNHQLQPANFDAICICMLHRLQMTIVIPSRIHPNMIIVITHCQRTRQCR